MLPESLLDILQGNSSDSSQGTSNSSHNNNGALLNAIDSDDGVNVWFEPVDGVDYVQTAVTTVFNNPKLLADIAQFVPDPPRPPSPLPRPNNAVRRSPRIEQAQGPPVRYRTGQTRRGQSYSVPLYAPLHPLDSAFDTVPSDSKDDSEDGVDHSDEGVDIAIGIEAYYQYLDQGGDPQAWRSEERFAYYQYLERGGNPWDYAELRDESEEEAED